MLSLAGCGDEDAPGRAQEPAPTGTPTVTWGAPEGEASCVWHPARREVAAMLRVTGTDLAVADLTVTVTAHADENTSQPVGSAHRTIPVAGTVDRTLRLVVRVTAEPYVDIDGVAACSLAVGP